MREEVVLRSLSKSRQEVFSATMLMSTWQVVANLRVTADPCTHLRLAEKGWRYLRELGGACSVWVS